MTTTDNNLEDEASEREIQRIRRQQAIRDAQAVGRVESAAVLRQRQPAPDTGGEWRVFEHYRKRVLDETGRVVAEAQTEEQAAQIVRDHRAVPLLVEALKGVAIMLNTELERYESEPWAQRVRVALTTAARLDRGEGR